MNTLQAIFGVGLFFVAFSLTGQSLPGNHYLAMDIANDVFYLPKRTDRYFSSGLMVEYGDLSLVQPVLGRLGAASVRRYWQLQQRIYTPENIQSADLLAGSRPFASYLVLSRGRDFADESLGFRLETEWTAGVLGKYSMGGKLQNAFHDMIEFAQRIPGWKHEVKTDVIFNYRMRFSRNLDYGKRLRIHPQAEARLGTLHTDFSAGLTAKLTAVKFSADQQLLLVLGGDARFVGYDATLSGGLLNTDDRYRGVVIPRRLVGTADLTALMDLEGWQLRAGVTTQSIDFENGQPHIWAWFGVSMSGHQRKK